MISDAVQEKKRSMILDIARDLVCACGENAPDYEIESTIDKLNAVVTRYTFYRDMERLV